MAQKILVVDDEKDLADLIAFNLEQEGYRVFKAADGNQALAMVSSVKPDLVLLDLMLPGLSGLEVCRRLRSRPETEHLPVLMVTAKGQEVDKILGLEMGADDYITKPFSVRELLARVRAVLRRVERKPDAEEVFSRGDLFIDYRSCEVRVRGRRVDLGPMEMKLLMFFAKNPGRVYSRDRLLEEVWGHDTFVEPRTVDVHISRLRAAVEEDRTDPRYILTVRGMGYKFDAGGGS